MSSDPWYCIKSKVEGPKSQKNSQRSCKTPDMVFFRWELFEKFYGPRTCTENGVKKMENMFCQ